MTRAIAILGTGSDVGKSVIAAGLCRILARLGCRVAPFKAQNMSLNSFVTHEGGEIGRAQALQALASRLAPSVDMNPVLLKPESDTRAQILVHGIPLHTREAAQYLDDHDRLWAAVTASYRRLADQYDAIVIEGAGSAAEVNLRARDLANWRMVEHADASVVLVADIDRGGVFAQIIGTLDLLVPQERARVRGVVVNKFRGDAALFEDGVRFLEERTGVPVLGIVPFVRDCRLEQEDGLPSDADRPASFSATTVNLGVVLLPRMSNVTDFLALAAEPDVALRYVRTPGELADADVVIIPGTKNTFADLCYLRDAGFTPRLTRHVEAGGELVGICGGYQMLGRTLSDPEGLEQGGELDGLGHLDVATIWQAPKICRQVEGQVIEFDGLSGLSIAGYEIHAGRTVNRAAPCFRIRPREAGPSGTRPATPDWETDGSIAPGGLVWGTGVHGVFDTPTFRRAWLNRVRQRKGLPALDPATSQAVSSTLEAALDGWADHLERHLDLAVIRRALALKETL